MDYLDIDNQIISLLRPEQAWHFKVIPYKVENSILYCLTTEPHKYHEEITLILNQTIEYIKLTDEALFIGLLNKYYRRQQLPNGAEPLTNMVGDTFDTLIKDAISLQSSDIHIEPGELHAQVRFRIDGKLIERFTLQNDKYAELVNQVKIKSGMDISEKRLPQDGRYIYRNMNTKFDLRISSVPTLYGEKIVARILGMNAETLDITQLGFSKEDLEKYLGSTRKGNGIILINGPTGSGKTTTLYATIKVLNQPAVNIVTIEDPIEYTLKGINQVQVKESIGLTFAHTLRSFLRQDPDIIMVGEIRDRETADLAIRASLTGHLVLSTIHTSSAWGVVNRLTDMGIPSFLIADTLSASVAQRLVRTLCDSCKIPIAIAELPKEAREYHIDGGHYYKAQGCLDCHSTGYKGRVAVYEVITINQELKELIKNESNTVSLPKEDTMQMRACLLWQQGRTSFEEIVPILLG